VGSAEMGLLEHAPGGMGSPRTLSDFGEKGYAAEKWKRPFSDGRISFDSSREGVDWFGGVQLGSGELVWRIASVMRRTNGTRC
jgi:hypothetical protein